MNLLILAGFFTSFSRYIIRIWRSPAYACAARETGMNTNTYTDYVESELGSAEPNRENSRRKITTAVFIFLLNVFFSLVAGRKTHNVINREWDDD